ncbi:putative pyrroloquinoline-quinone binding quinoprotein [Primorskyibacter sedentarius]|uniref:Putative pyrroloquinoline-quinone binding quinoprotein n=1 Tax=Primorskyibacter sedentarius TaxID=745311 RepID=A0A4R3JDG6_9RHOB|nr:PQQ-like beta-propeller repeat protein [Primorskyibacter sedentarius]TCS63754.1 putative pyrroloquinoline-quinone binding quinoprotein [Primorskyibacter sedentarius]
MAGLAGLVLLGACGEREVVLPGERLGVREVLQSEEGFIDQSEALNDGVNRAEAISLPAMSTNGSWPQAAGSPLFRVDHARLSSSLTPVWSANIGQGDKRRVRISTDPVADAGRIFTMDSASTVTATGTDGATLWQASVAPARDGVGDAGGGGLAVGGGRLFVTSGFGTLTALDPATGAEIWQQKLEATGTGTPSYHDGIVYVVSGDSTAWALEADTGRIRWQLDGFADITNVSGGPAPVVSDKQVVFSFGSNELQSTFREGGIRLWSTSLAGQRQGSVAATVSDVTGDPMQVGNVIYAGTHSGRTMALNADSGERLWTARDGALDGLWATGGSVFFVSDRNELLRLDASDGSRIWSTPLPGYTRENRPRKRKAIHAHYGPILAGGRLIVASSDGQIRSFDPVSGALAGSVAIPGGAKSRPIVMGGVLYVVSGNGQLHAFR